MNNSMHMVHVSFFLFSKNKSASIVCKLITTMRLIISKTYILFICLLLYLCLFLLFNRALMQRAGLRASPPGHAHSKKMRMRAESVPMNSANTFLLPPEDPSDQVSRSGAESGRNARNSCGIYSLALKESMHSNNVHLPSQPQQPMQLHKMQLCREPTQTSKLSSINAKQS